MYAAEFAAIRVSNGFSITQLAKYLRVNERNVRRWEAGVMKVSDRIATAMEELQDATDSAVAQLVETEQVATIVIDDDFESWPDMPEGWRLVVARRVKRERADHPFYPMDVSIFWTEEHAMA